MNLEIPETIREFADSASRSITAAGGVDLARGAELEPARRERDVRPLLGQIGLDDIDPFDDIEAALAAAELCRVAGATALPYPVEAFLLNVDGVPFASVGSRPSFLDHGDLAPTWLVASTTGATAGTAVPTGAPMASKLGPFVTPVRVDASQGPSDQQARAAMASTLSSYRVLGTVERALELAVEHTQDRVQFGKPLMAFQSIQFQLADTAVAVAGLRELAHYTIWSVSSTPAPGTVDALALRAHALDVGQRVLRTTQQLHGAVGLCDEHDLSVLCRHIQPHLRLPDPAGVVATQLLAAIEEEGFDSLFSERVATG